MTAELAAAELAAAELAAAELAGAGATGCCQVTTATDSREAADALARSAVEARLAACAQVVGPVNSTYRWQGAIAGGQEWLVLFKSTVETYAELAAHLLARHSYDLPEIVCTPIVDGNPAYLAWVRAETG